jgi:hypothetical protein
MSSEKIFASLWLVSVRYVPVMVLALLGMLVNIWRKSDCTVVCAQFM